MPAEPKFIFAPLTFAFAIRSATVLYGEFCATTRIGDRMAPCVTPAKSLIGS